MITSTAFASGSEIPSRYTCQGKDISPPLAWTDGPAGTKSFALIIDDPDAPDPAAPQMTWVHWILYNVDSKARNRPSRSRPLSLPDSMSSPACRMVKRSPRHLVLRCSWSGAATNGVSPITIPRHTFCLRTERVRPPMAESRRSRRGGRKSVSGESAAAIPASPGSHRAARARTGDALPFVDARIRASAHEASGACFDFRAGVVADVHALADQRMAELGQVDSNLMLAPGFEATFDERGTGKRGDRSDVRHRPFRIDRGVFLRAPEIPCEPRMPSPRSEMRFVSTRVAATAPCAMA